MNFKQWWNEQEIMCGEGGMDAAESAWNHQQQQRIAELEQRCGRFADKKVEAEQRIAELEAQKKAVYCEAIALLTQVNGTPTEVAAAHDYLTKVYAEQLTDNA